MAQLISLAQQIKGHLGSSGALTADQLAAITGEDVFRIIDALTYLLGTEAIAQDNSPRYRLLKAGASPRSPDRLFVPPERCGSQAPAFRGRTTEGRVWSYVVPPQQLRAMHWARTRNNRRTFWSRMGRLRCRNRRRTIHALPALRLLDERRRSPRIYWRTTRR